MSTITIQIPDHLRKRLDQIAVDEGFTVDQFLTIAASEKLAALETVDYIRGRAERANPEKLQDALDAIPDTPVSEPWEKIDN